MKKLKRFIRLITFHRQYLRLRTVLSYYSPTIKEATHWINEKSENDNFYYSLTPQNTLDLISAVSIVTGNDPEKISGYIQEISNNQEILSHIEGSWKSDPNMSDARIGLARRVGWYAVIRSCRPSLIVETGVSHGVGALVICAALERNLEEGYPGRYIGTDINPLAGKLLLPRFQAFASILVGDSLESLSKLSDPVDIFINDSDHSAEYEASEYKEIHRLLSERAVILGDNSHVTGKLRDYSYANDKNYLFFAEKPDRHWYPGAGIGFSFPK